MFFFFQAEDGIRDHCVTGVQTCALPISFVRMLPGTAACVVGSYSCVPGSNAEKSPFRKASFGRLSILLLPVLKRSEEHTSELQSHSDLVCRLLLEKKKKNKI